MRTFTYSVTPVRTDEGDLQCNLSVVKCDDEELLVNAQQYMNEGLSAALKANPHLYFTLEELVDKDSSIMLRFVLTFDKEYDIIIDDNVVGKIELNIPIEKVDTHYQLQKAVEKFLTEIERIIADEKKI